LAALQRKWGTSGQPLISKQPMGTKIQVLPGKLAAKKTSINIISPSMFHLNRVESGKDSLEAHLQSLKTSRGSY
jgi:hypothetical protein